MSDTVELHLPARSEFVGHAAALCRYFCQQCGGDFSPTVRYDIELSVSEACTNAVKYSTFASGDVPEMIVRFTLGQEALEIAVLSRGPAFSLADVPQPDFDRHPPGGYGLYLIQQQMEQVALVYHEGWNVLSMSKRRR